MLTSKRDVDRHVLDLLNKSKNDTEKLQRGFNFAKLYYKVKEYDTAKKYLTGYLGVKNNAIAHRLMGQIHEASNNLEVALDSYKRSLELDQNQDSLILKICEIYTQIPVDHETARYWAEKGDSIYPHNDVIFKLRECIVNTDGGSNSKEIEDLIQNELVHRPGDIILIIKLIKFYLDKERINEAYALAIKEDNKGNFYQNLTWHYCLQEVFEVYQEENKTKLNQTFYLHFLVILSRLVALTLAETHALKEKRSSSLSAASSALNTFDQQLYRANAFKLSTSGDGWSYVLQQMKGQLYFFLATIIIKKSQKEQGNKKEAMRFAAPLLLIAHTFKPVNLLLESWFSKVKELQKIYLYVFDQAGIKAIQSAHIISLLCKEDQRVWLKKIKNELCIVSIRDRIYHRAFDTGTNKQLSPTSQFLSDPAYMDRSLEFPQLDSLQDSYKVVQQIYSDSLHHLVWLALSGQPRGKLQLPFIFQLFEGLPLSMSFKNRNTCGPESLCRLDMESFLQATIYLSRTALNARKEKMGVVIGEALLSVPVDIAIPMCTEDQAEWWHVASMLINNLAKDHLADYRRTLQHGLGVIRGIGNHGLDVRLTIHLAHYFSEKATDLKGESEDLSALEVAALEERAGHYWQVSLPILDKLFQNQTLRTNPSPLFQSIAQPLSTEEVIAYKEEGELFLACLTMNQGDLEAASHRFEKLSSAHASFYLALCLKQLADDNNKTSIRGMTPGDKQTLLLTRARSALYTTLDRIRGEYNHPLNLELHREIEEVETRLAGSHANHSDCEEESPNISRNGSIEHVSSFLKSPPYFTPTHAHSSSRPTRPSLERLDAQIRLLMHSQEKIEQTMSAMSTNIMDKIEDLSKTFNSMKLQLDDIGQEKQNAVKKKEKRFTQRVPQQQQQLDFDEDNYEAEEDYREDEELLNNLTPRGRPAPHQMWDYYGHMPSPYDPRVAHLPPPHPMNLPPQMYPQHYPHQQYGLPQPPPPPHNRLSCHNIPPATPPSFYNPPPPQPQPYPTQLLPMPFKPPPMVPPPSLGDSHPISLVTSTPSQSTQSFVSSTPSKGTPVHPFQIEMPVTSPVKTERSRVDSVVSDVSDVSHDALPDFKPIIPLPEEVSVTTGEENEKVLFKEQAKLYRFVDKEWKERGAGILKILKNEDSGKLRILMRRDQVLKVCANHHLTSKMSFSPMKKNDKTWVWAAQDFSEGEVNNEQFCVRFKTVDQAAAFKTVIDIGLKELTQIERKVAANPTSQSFGTTGLFSSSGSSFGFGDKFKPVAGSWTCKICYISNMADKTKCLACETPRPGAAAVTPKSEVGTPVPPQTVAAPSQPSIFSQLALSKGNSFNFDAKFHISMEPSNNTNEPKNIFGQAITPPKTASSITPSALAPVLPKASTQSSGFFQPPISTQASQNTSFFSQLANKLQETSSVSPTASSISVISTPSKQTTPSIFSLLSNLETSKTDSASSFGVFSNTASNQSVDVNSQLGSLNICSPSPSTLANNSKPSIFTLPQKQSADNSSSGSSIFGVPPKQSDSVFSSTTLNKGSSIFGLAQKQNETTPGKTSTSIFATNQAKDSSSSTPIFGVTPKKNEDSSPAATLFGANASQNLPKTSIFGNLPMSENPPEPSFTSNKLFGKVAIPKQPSAEQSTPKLEVKASPFANFSFLSAPSAAQSKDSATTDSKPSPFKNLSTLSGPAKATSNFPENKSSPLTREELEEFVPTAQFKPVIDLPDVVDLKTGEEDEEKLFGERAKLYRYDAEAKQWKEKGKGEIKILKNKETGKARILMRREQVLKICANHVITNDNVLQNFNQSDTTWMYNACNYEDGEVKPEKLAVRFKTVELAAEFKHIFEKSQVENQLITTEAIKTPSTSVPADNKVPIKELFRPKPGSWNCSTCLVNNQATNTVCASCSTPNTSDTKPADKLPLKDLFKPKQGSWQCPDCYVHNEESQSLCLACGGKNPSNSKPAQFSFGSVKQNNFVFGGGNSSQVFGNASFTTTNPIFNVPRPKTPEQTGSPAGFKFGSPQKYDFNFEGVKPGSPVKNPKSPGILSDGGEDEVEPSEADNIYFQPVIPLPPKVDVKTGEEGEEVLYSHRAKLFRFIDGEWKERGIGDVKILKCPQTQKLRLLMRREKVLKVCLNHILTPEITFSSKGDKAWNWMATDFSEGVANAENFCIRFKAPEIAQEFKEALDHILKLDSSISSATPFTKSSSYTEDDDVKITFQKKASPAQIELAKKLQLPETFYLYETSPNCSGCRGCKDFIPKIGERSSSDSSLELIPPIAANPVPEESGANKVPLEDNSIFSGTKITFADLAVKNQPSFLDKPAATNFHFPGAGSKIFFGIKQETTGNEDNEGDVEASVDIHFEPVIPLPDLVEVKTGEENEDAVYCHRAKLFRWDQDTQQWKERGVGDFKVLKNKSLNKFRLLLRRDQVHKVVCNHNLSENLVFAPLSTSDVSLCWSAIDFSELVEGQMEKFAIKFKNVEIKNNFLENISAFQQELKSNAGVPQPTQPSVASNPIVSPPQVCDSDSSFSGVVVQPEVANSPNFSLSDSSFSGVVLNSTLSFNKSNTSSSVIRREEEEVDEEEEDEDDDDEYDDDDPEKIIMFEEFVHFSVLDSASTIILEDAGSYLQMTYDDSIFGARIQVFGGSDEEMTLTDHHIAIQTCLHKHNNIGTWTAVDNTLDPPQRRTVSCRFASNQVLEDFAKAFEEGKEFALQAEIVEQQDSLPFILTSGNKNF